ncbi:LysR family transcriptional regulator [Acetobacter conturbans]|uniref:LysR family transcriptional regulator n=1 Tax=Acetobacter conturbans TaxID=1737472 RepID=UPI001F5560E2|nr:LysR family transcriptional regulator [Acetobacter conturbans]
MRLRGFEYFRIVVEAGSLGRAARCLGVSPSTLSRAIDNLEDELGVTLLERNKRGVRLTCSGRVIFSKIRDLIDIFHDIKMAGQSLGSAARGIINI